MNFQKIKFDNGLRLILAPQPVSSATTVMVLVEAGSKYETKEINGLSHFLEHMCFKGTTKRPTQLAISTELDNLGAEYNAFTSREYTGYYAKARNENFDKILDVVTDMYLNPLFDPEEINKERGPIIEEINMYEDLPMQKVSELFFNLVYGDQPAGWSVAGTKENILRLQREDFINYRKAHYVAQSTIVIVAGGFSAESVEEKIRNVFTALKVNKKSPKAPVVEEQGKARFSPAYKTTDQTHLVLGFRAFDVHDERRFALGILADILGGGISSRLFQKIRSELGAAYYISASPDFYTDHGLFLISAGVSNDKVEEAVRIALSECFKLKENLIDERELRKVKEHLIGHLFLSLESSDEFAVFYGSQEISGNPLMVPQVLAQRIQAVTAEEIRKVARFIFENNRLNLAFIGPLKDKDFGNILKI
jgi:predicted Zn-dependent peptidase